MLRMSSASSPEAALAARLRRRIRAVPDYPKPGVRFRDITPLLGDPEAFRDAVEAMAAPFASSSVDAVAGIEARGFLFGAPVALRLGAAFVPLRKAGKLPGEVVEERYALEYGAAALEARADAPAPGRRVLVVDDVLATGGTAGAAFRLLGRLGAEVVGFSFLLALSDLGGEQELGALGARMQTLLRFS